MSYFADLFLLEWPPKMRAFFRVVKLSVREFVLTLCILKTNFHLYLFLGFDLSLNFRPEMLVADRYITRLKIVANVSNDDFLSNIFGGFRFFQNISCKANLAGREILRTSETCQTRLELYDNLC